MTVCQVFLLGGLVWFRGLTPQQQPGSYQGGEMMMKSVFWWRKPEHPDFSLDVTEELKRETESARAHNMDSEEIMGMFSAAKQKAPKATLCFLSCRVSEWWFNAVSATKAIFTARTC